MIIGYSTVTQKGQVTIPADMRRSLNIIPNEQVIFVRANGHIELKPLPDITTLRGSVKPIAPYNEKVMRQSIVSHIIKHHERGLRH